MFAWLWSWRRVSSPIRRAQNASASGQSVTVAGEIIKSRVQFGLKGYLAGALRSYDESLPFKERLAKSV
jgi:hypothetical protein